MSAATPPPPVKDSDETQESDSSNTATTTAPQPEEEDDDDDDEERSIPFNVSMPYKDWQKLKAEAKRRGTDRSKIIREAMQFYYHYRQNNIYEQAKESESKND